MRLINGDCLKEMEKIKDKSVDLILIDPPYNIKKAEWDSWKTVDEYVEFMGQVFNECQRVLKDNGSFYFFHNDFLQVSELQHWIRQNTKFVFNSFIIWNKEDFRALSWKNPKESNKLRGWFNVCEYCLFYTKQKVSKRDKTLDTSIFSKLMLYFKEEKEKTKLNYKQLDELMNVKASYSYWDKVTTHEYSIPNEENYKKLQSTGHFKIPYEEIKKEFDNINMKFEKQRYTHNLDANHNNVWTSTMRNAGKLHPTQKPLDILERIIKTSSNEGDIILDCFMGSGSTGVACANTNRDFIGIELDEKYFKIAEQRIKEAQQKEVN